MNPVDELSGGVAALPLLPGLRTDAGAYGLPQAGISADDFSANVRTTGLVPVGGSRGGVLELRRDRDWFATELQAGRTYAIRQVGVGLSNPLLRLRSDRGRLLATNDDAEGSRNSLITWTADRSGRFFLEAGAWRDSLTGSYRVSVTDVTPSPVTPPPVTPPPMTPPPTGPVTNPPPLGFSSVEGYGELNVARALDLLTGVPLPRQAALGGVHWALDRIGAPSAWAAGINGAGITVAVVDTGVDHLHPDLQGTLWSNSREIAGNGLDDDANGYVDDALGWDFVDGDNDPMDAHGHGTHVAGLIAAQHNGQGGSGVAPGARIMPVRVLGASGTGSFSTVASGVRYAVANGARVINLSITGAIGTPDLAAAIVEASSLGALVVMAAGNEGAASPADPAAFAAIAGLAGLAVGAVDSSGLLAAFSNRAGPTPLDYLTAPGVGLISSLPGASFGSLTGTSMAAPLVAGAAALLLSQRPTLTALDLEGLLIASASRGSGQFNPTAAGPGPATAATAEPLPVPAPAPAPASAGNRADTLATAAPLAARDARPTPARPELERSTMEQPELEDDEDGEGDEPQPGRGATPWPEALLSGRSGRSEAGSDAFLMASLPLAIKKAAPKGGPVIAGW